MRKRPCARVAVAIYDSERVLLLDYRSAEGQWRFLPGGGVELGESIRDAAVRECREGVGLEITLGQVMCVSESIRTVREALSEEPKVDGHAVHIVLRAAEWSGEVRVEDHPHVHGFAWHDVNALRGLNLYPPVGLALAANAYNESEQAPYLQWTEEMRRF